MFTEKRAERLRMIVALLLSEEIPSNKFLSQRLADNGFTVSNAAVSFDLADLGVRREVGAFRRRLMITVPEVLEWYEAEVSRCGPVVVKPASVVAQAVLATRWRCGCGLANRISYPTCVSCGRPKPVV